MEKDVPVPITNWQESIFIFPYKILLIFINQKDFFIEPFSIPGSFVPRYL